MKKLILLLVALLLISCNLSNTPKDVVEEYLSQYNALNDSIVLEIDAKVASEELSTDNKKLYKKVLLRQYEDLKYEIKEESINDDKAEVLVKINVYDLYKANKESSDYMNLNQNEFNNINNIFDNNLYNEYRLNKMLDTNDRVEYSIKFYLNKKDDEWSLIEPNRDVLEKIHGIYDYEND